MRAIVNTPDGPGRIELRDGVAEPAPEPDQALVAVEAFSINRGELALLSSRPAGWQPGQDIAGTVLAAATDGSGPRAGSWVWSRTPAGPSRPGPGAPARRTPRAG